MIESDTEVNARLTAAAPELLGAAIHALDLLRSVPIESGVCFCGDPIAAHNMSSGHSPVDDLAVLADHIALALSTAIGKAKGKE